MARFIVTLSRSIYLSISDNISFSKAWAEAFWSGVEIRIWVMFERLAIGFNSGNSQGFMCRTSVTEVTWLHHYTCTISIMLVDTNIISPVVQFSLTKRNARFGIIWPQLCFLQWQHLQSNLRYPNTELFALDYVSLTSIVGLKNAILHSNYQNHPP